MITNDKITEIFLPDLLEVEHGCGDDLQGIAFVIEVGFFHEATAVVG